MLEQAVTIITPFGHLPQFSGVSREMITFIIICFEQTDSSTNETILYSCKAIQAPHFVLGRRARIVLLLWGEKQVLVVAAVYAMSLGNLNSDGSSASSPSQGVPWSFL